MALRHEVAGVGVCGDPKTDPITTNVKYFDGQYGIFMGGAASGGFVIPFIEKTWFLWWFIAVIAIVRWFQLFSATTDVGLPASPPSVQEETPVRSSEWTRTA
jgi:hypothetical protein